MAQRFGGFGSEPFGDPSGSGGPLAVLRARAIKGQLVRVTFNEEPLHQSPAGKNDALNPANYFFTCTSGELYEAAVGTAPTVLPTLVDASPIQGPGIGLTDSTEWAVDVHTDKPLVVGLTYSVTVVNVLAKLGGTLASPASAEFPGIVRNTVATKPRNNNDLVDIGSDLITGHFLTDDSGDLSPQGGVDGLRKRIFRRLTTNKGAFPWMSDYGVGLRLKEPGSLAQMQLLKTDVVQQIGREPDVASVEAYLSLDQSGILTLQINAIRKGGTPITLTTRRLADGTVMQ